MADHYLDKEGLRIYDSTQKQRINTMQTQIEEIKEKGGGSLSLYIKITCTEDYNGQTFTATGALKGSVYTAEAQEGSAVIQVNDPGDYTITNTLNEKSQTVTVGEPFVAETEFSVFSATVKVNIPESLQGLTLTCEKDGSSQEKKATGTSVEFTVTSAGDYKIGVKDNTYISKVTATVSNDKETKTVTLTVGSNVPLINLTVAEELVGENIKCAKETFSIVKKAQTTSLSFVVNELGNYTLSLDEASEFYTTVNVEQAKAYSATLTLNDAHIPIIVMRSKSEDNGKTFKCSKDEHNLEKVLTNKRCTFILPETGTWTITCDSIPEITKKVNVAESKAYKCAFRASIIGVTVTQTESDPERRVEYTDDAEGMSPVKVNTADGTIDYGEWRYFWIFDKIRPCMLKTDGTVDYYLDPEDQTQKAEGGASDINNINYDGNAMVELEKFYIKMRMEGDTAYIQLSDEEEDGFVPMGFKRADGSEMDKAYIGMFKGSFDSQSRLRSIANQSLRCNTSFSDFQKAAQKMGTDYHLETNGLINMIDALYLILFKNFDSQTAAGRGRDYGSGSGNTMTIKSGFLSNKGPIAYDKSSQGVKFMWIEDHWMNNAYWWLDGWLYKAGNPGPMYMKFGGPYNDTGDGYTKVTGYTPGSGNISKSVWSNEFGKIPNESQGSTSTYECDSYNTTPGDTSNVCACYRAIHGVWSRVHNTVSNTSYNFGAGLSFEPPKGA